jgi:hypothetical protein
MHTAGRINHPLQPQFLLVREDRIQILLQRIRQRSKLIVKL